MVLLVDDHEEIRFIGAQVNEHVTRSAAHCVSSGIGRRTARNPQAILTL
jgi:hypothetical protein